MQPVFGAEDHLSGLIGVSPFGIHCNDCHAPLSLTKLSLRNHLKSKHSANNSMQVESAVIDSFVQNAQAAILRLHTEQDVVAGLTDKTKVGVICNGCGHEFNERSNYRKHCRLPSNNCISNKAPQTVVFFETHYYRDVSQTQIDEICPGLGASLACEKDSSIVNHSDGDFETWPALDPAEPTTPHTVAVTRKRSHSEFEESTLPHPTITPLSATNTQPSPGLEAIHHVECFVSSLPRLQPSPSYAGSDVILSSLESFLQPRLNDMEDTALYTPFLYNYFMECGGTAELFHSSIVHNCELAETSSMKSLQQDDAILHGWLCCCEQWLERWYKLAIESVAGNLRYVIQAFGGQEHGEDNAMVHNTFTPRTSIQRLSSELKKIIKFVAKCPPSKRSIIYDVDLQKPNQADMLTILVRLLCDDGKKSSNLPLILEYAIARCFRLSNQLDGQVLRMNSCAYYSSVLSDILHILRAGLCGYLANNKDWAAEGKMALCARARDSVFVNLSSPMIRRCKEAHRRKGVTTKTSIDPETGDIFLNNSVFRYQVWSNFIPIVVSECSLAFDALFTNGVWRDVLALSNSKEVHYFKKEKHGDSFFRVKLGHCAIDESSLQFTTRGVDQSIAFDRLTALINIGLRAFGGGGARASEIDGLKCGQVFPHMSTLYYEAQKMKQASVKKSLADAGMIQRKMPVTFAPCYALYRAIIRWDSALANQAVTGSSPAVTVPADTSSPIASVYKQLFNLSDDVSLRDIRQFEAAMNNFISPDQTQSISSANPIAANLAGHSVTTHRVNYSSNQIIAESDSTLREKHFDHYHQSLGEQLTVSGLVKQNDLSHRMLLDGLKALHGDDAGYRVGQRELVENSASTLVEKHTVADIDCGVGKNAGVIVPMAAAAIHQVYMGIVIVITPYKFLAACHQRSYQEKLGRFFASPDVVLLESHQIEVGVLPSCLTQLENGIVVVGIDTMAVLLQRHSQSLATMAQHDSMVPNQLKLHRIFFDEWHVLIQEWGFRDVAFSSICQLGQLGVPVTMMSATLPSCFVPTLMHRLQLITTPDSNLYRLICGHENAGVLGPFPHGFRFHVRGGIEPKESLVMEAKAICSRISRSQQTPIHLFCASKDDAKELFKMIPLDLGNKAIVTGDTISQEQVEVAEAWMSGKIQVLITTSIGCVGNENPNCRHLIIVGFLHNLATFVQAVNRLRTSQRTSAGTITVLLPKLGPGDFTRAKEEYTSNWEKVLHEKVVNRASHDMYKNVFCLIGMYASLRSERKCCLSIILNEKFGRIQTPSCGVCNYCREPKPDSQIHHAKNVAVAKQDAVNSRSSATQSLFNSLRSLCLRCRKTGCDGEKCYIQGTCVRCGGNHLSTDCQLRRSLGRLRGVCMGCLDSSQRIGYFPHKFGGRQCVLERRFVAILQHRFYTLGRDGELIAGFSSQSQSENGDRFADYCSWIHSNLNDHFYPEMKQIADACNIRY